MADTPRETRTTCPYCGVGCGVIVTSAGDRITAVRGDPDHPANRGRLCTKGQTLHLTATPALRAQARLLEPRLHGQAVTWETALDTAADRIVQAVRTRGPGAVGFYVSGQLLTEDYHAFNKLARGVVGTPHIDTNSRLCMSSAVAGYKRTLGADAPPACYDDIAHAQCLFVAGSNAAWAHPVLWRRVEVARAANPSQKLVVVDPRRTETAAQADLHLALLPGTDVALFHGLLHVMLWEGLVDHAFVAAHTSGFDALKALVREHTPRATAQLTGLREDDIVQAARWFGGSGATLSLYCQGLNQSSAGTDKNAALINLHLATGQIGKPGAGPLSLTGQPNAMGGREAGGMATLLPGHRDPADAAHRAEVAALWGVPALPEAPGHSALELFEAAAAGEIEVLWIACTNPAQSLPDQALVQRALARTPFVVLQEAFEGTATARHAHLLLPASTWGEKEGTVTNSERCISRVRAAVPPPGQARADWAIACDVGRRVQAQLAPERPEAMAFDGPEALWQEHRESTRGRDLDITGLSWARLEAGPQPWPCPDSAAPGRARLYTDGRFATPDGRARFAAVPYRPLAEPRDARYPFALNTGRLRDQWHGLSRSGRVPGLWAHEPEPVAELHPQELARLRVQEGQLLRLRSRRGELLLPARASTSLGPAQVHVAMHWGPEVMAGGVNRLTSPARCPSSRQPELKHAAVAVEPVAADTLPWRVVAAAWLADEAEALHARAALAACTTWAPYAVLVPFGADGARAEGPCHGLLLRLAAPAPLAAAQIDTLVNALGLAAPGVLRYDDPRRHQQRRMRLSRASRPGLQALLLAGDVTAAAWLLPLLQSGAPLPAGLAAPALLAPLPRPPVAVPAPDRPLCNCLGVGRGRIDAVLARTTGSAAERLQALQRELACGTQCGSCLPELRRLAAGVGVPA